MSVQLGLLKWSQKKRDREGASLDVRVHFETGEHVFGWYFLLGGEQAFSSPSSLCLCGKSRSSCWSQGLVGFWACVFSCHPMPRWCNASTERERERGVFLDGEGGGMQLESELVCWECCDHAGDEGDEEGRVVGGFRRRVLSGLDACKINILWTLPLH